MKNIQVQRSCTQIKNEKGKIFSFSKKSILIILSALMLSAQPAHAGIFEWLMLPSRWINQFTKQHPKVAGGLAVLLVSAMVYDSPRTRRCVHELLYKAIENDNFLTAKILLRISSKHIKECALNYAIFLSKKEFIKMFNDYGVYVNATYHLDSIMAKDENDDYWYNLFCQIPLTLGEKQWAFKRAVENKKYRIIARLLVSGAEITGDVLGEFARSGDQQMLSLLTDQGIASSRLNECGSYYTPLEESCNSGNYFSFLTLIRHGANPFGNNRGGHCLMLSSALADPWQSVQNPKISKFVKLLYIFDQSREKTTVCDKRLKSDTDWLAGLEEAGTEATAVMISHTHDAIELIQEFKKPTMTEQKKNMVNDIVSSLSAEEKEEFRQAFCGYFQHTESLNIALMLYEYFNDAAALTMYCNGAGKAPRAQGPFENAQIGSAYAQAKERGDFEVVQMLEKTFYFSELL